MSQMSNFQTMQLPLADPPEATDLVLVERESDAGSYKVPVSALVAANSVVLSATVTLTAMDMDQLDTVAIPIVAAPGANKVVVPVQLFASIKFNGGTTQDLTSFTMDCFYGADTTSALGSTFVQGGGMQLTRLPSSLPMVKTCCIALRPPTLRSIFFAKMQSILLRLH